MTIEHCILGDSELTILVLASQARTKYETDALDITGMHARAALSQGRELDKVRLPAFLSYVTESDLQHDADYPEDGQDPANRHRQRTRLQELRNSPRANDHVCFPPLMFPGWH